MDEVKQLNDLIARGLVDVSMNNPNSLSTLVFGIKKARYGKMTWSEIKGRFLGGGIYESYGYELRIGSNSIIRDNYRQSLKLFLAYIKKCEGIQ